jgi:hypothetical protein
LAGFDPPLDSPVILFHEVIEVTSDPMPAGFLQNPVAFELRDRRRVSAPRRLGGVSQTLPIKEHFSYD